MTTQGLELSILVVQVSDTESSGKRQLGTEHHLREPWIGISLMVFRDL
jgi:hypothetical protein